MPGPLDGIRIIDLSVMISGPLATMLLAEQGADVIKVETPGLGDLMRYLGSRRGGVTGIYANNNRGKRAITLDLKQPSGVAVLHELIRSADVLVQNFRPGATERIGIGVEQCHLINPDLIYVSISGFGQDGPHAGRRVYDNIIQAYSGLASVQAHPADNKPTLLRNLVCDKVTAYTAAQAITAALLARATGKARGQHIELAMLDAAVSFLWPDAAMDVSLLEDDTVRSPTIGSSYMATAMADGYTANSIVSDAEWRGWCTAVDRTDLIDDERFATTSARSANARVLGPLIREVMSTQTVSGYLAAAERHEVPAAPILSLSDLPDDPQVQHNELFTVIDHPTAGRIRTPRPAPRLSATPACVGGPAPLLGEHTDEIVNDLGLDLDALRAAGAFGSR